VFHVPAQGDKLKRLTGSDAPVAAASAQRAHLPQRERHLPSRLLAAPDYRASHAIIIDDSSSEGTSMHERYPHPSRQPLLPLTMVVSVVLGVLFLRVGGQYAKFGGRIRVRLVPGLIRALQRCLVAA
jgi:hypothetical protein